MAILSTDSAQAQSTSRNVAPVSVRDVRGKAPVVPLTSEPLARLFVDDPLADPLTLGRVVVQCRTENLHIVPVYGPAALAVSPRIGYLLVTVDDTDWHWLDASNEPLTIKGLPPGPHRILVELADSAHKVIDAKTIDFVILPYQ